MKSSWFLAAVLLTLSCWASPSVAREQEAEGVDPPQRLVPRLVRPAPTTEREAPPPPPVVEDASDPRERPGPAEEPPPAIVNDLAGFEQDVETAPATQKVWYGWQNLLVDGAGHTLAFGLVALIASRDDGAQGMGVGLVTLGFASYALGGPIVHFAHGNVGKGFGSLGLRVGLPAAGFGTGVALACGGSEDDISGLCVLFGFPGLILGAVTAIALDAGVLAYKTVPAPHAAARSRGLKSLAVLPLVSTEGGGLSVNGLF